MGTGVFWDRGIAVKLATAAVLLASAIAISGCGPQSARRAAVKETAKTVHASKHSTAPPVTFNVNAQLYLPFPTYIPAGFTAEDVRIFGNNEVALDYIAPKIDRYGPAQLWFQEYVSRPPSLLGLCTALRTIVALNADARAIYCVYYDGPTTLYGLYYKAVSLNQSTWIWEQVNYPHQPGASADLRQWQPELIRIAQSSVHDGWSLAQGAPVAQ